MARTIIDPKVKAQALADLMDGDQPATVAARYGIPSAAVRKMKSRLVTPDVTDNVTPRVTIMHRPAIEMQQLAIGDLIMENLRAKLIATQKIAEYATTPQWIEKQSASDVAALFVALDQSAVAILDRLAQRGHGGESADPAGAAPDATR